MGKALQNTSWPSVAIPSDGKDLIGKFFSLVDLSDPNSGMSLAEEVFAEDGVFVAVSSKFVGSEGTYFIDRADCTIEDQSKC